MNQEQDLVNQINAMSHNELVEALHANGIAPSGKYGAANLIASDKEKAVKMLIEKITTPQQ
jgi:hypothetical protein